MKTTEEIRTFQESSTQTLEELKDQTYDFMKNLNYQDSSAASYIIDRLEATQELINEITVRLTK